MPAAYGRAGSGRAVTVHVPRRSVAAIDGRRATLQRALLIAGSCTNRGPATRTGLARADSGGHVSVVMSRGRTAVGRYVWPAGRPEQVLSQFSAGGVSRVPVVPGRASEPAPLRLCVTDRWRCPGLWC